MAQLYCSVECVDKKKRTRYVGSILISPFHIHKHIYAFVICMLSEADG